MKNRIKKRLKLGVLVFAFALIGTEIFLRCNWGFCNTILYRADNDYEYIQIPQSRNRFGNNNFYNSFSQRNDEISDADSIIISLFGDSVINGGTLTDQDSLASSKLTKYLNLKLNKQVKVLNISAGSWGPDNCFAYLKKYGDFKTKKIVLIVSSHDAHDNMTFEKTVDIHPSYPTKQHKLAFLELIERYLLPRIFKTAEKKRIAFNHNSNVLFNSGFANFYNYTKELKIPFLIYLHAEKKEWELKNYNEEGQEIIEFCRKYNIPLIKELDYQLPSGIYRDDIHPNSLGQQYIFEILKDSIL